MAEINEKPPEVVTLSYSNIFLLAILLFCWSLLASGNLWKADPEQYPRDISAMCLPNLAFMGEAIKEGFVPTLHPRRGAGSPFLADPQTCSFYPFTWLAAVFAGPTNGFLIHQIAHLWWLGLGFSVFFLYFKTWFFVALISGCTVIATSNHLSLLEWVPIMAGTAWVPWSFFFIVRGKPSLCLLCLAFCVLSGHAYLWVMLIVLIPACWYLSPEEKRYPFLRSLFLLPFLTAPVLMGYFSLGAEVSVHGVTGQSTVTGFEPFHLAQFFFSRMHEDYIFVTTDEQFVSNTLFGTFCWTRFCYLGLLPILLFPISLRKTPVKLLNFAFLLGGGGLVMSMLLPQIAGILPDVFRKMHHPASFIQLTTWSLLILFPFGIRALLSTEETEIEIKLKWFYLILSFVLFVGAIAHFGLAGMALKEKIDPFWFYLFDKNWENYLLGILLTLILSKAFFIKSVENAIPVWVLLVLSVIHFGDLVVHGFYFSPRQDKVSKVQNFWEKIPKSTERIKFFDDFAFKHFPNHPNVIARLGYWQFDDYNPPFVHPDLLNWGARIISASAPKDLERLLALSNVGFAVCAPHIFQPHASWSLIAAYSHGAETTNIYLYRAAHSYPAVILGSASLTCMTDGEIPEPDLILSSAAVKWAGPDVNVSLGDYSSVSNPVLFVPLAPYRDWKAKIDGVFQEVFARKGFGLAVALPRNAKNVGLAYKPTFLLPAMIIWAFGWIGFLIMLFSRNRK